VADDYFIGVHAGELERLRDQHAAWKPETEALWARAGFSAGQHLVDLGSGPGFTAFDLGDIVGPSGRVGALDKASPFLRFIDEERRRRCIDNLYTIEADLTQMDGSGEAFDGAFCRFLLAFLVADLDRVLQCVYRSLKPGGVLAAMEYLTLGSTTCSPPIRGFDAHTKAWTAFYRDHGGDTAVGTYLPHKLALAGFAVTHIDCVGGIARPGERWWAWWGRLMDDFGAKLVGEGLMSESELRDLKTDWAAVSRDPGAFIYTPVLLQVVARKPDASGRTAE
jgi:SAM-dependent methyltransferase